MCIFEKVWRKFVSSSSSSSEYSFNRFVGCLFWRVNLKNFGSYLWCVGDKVVCCLLLRSLCVLVFVSVLVLILFIVFGGLVVVFVCNMIILSVVIVFFVWWFSFFGVLLIFLFGIFFFYYFVLWGNFYWVCDCLWMERGVIWKRRFWILRVVVMFWIVVWVKGMIMGCLFFFRVLRVRVYCCVEYWSWG